MTLNNSYSRPWAKAALLLAGSTLALAGGAHAQTEPAPAAATGGLQDIIVTAQKRAEPLQDVPLTVSAFNADALANQHFDALTGLKGLVPGMTISRSGASLNTPQISLRGISMQDVSRAVESGIGFAIDGVPLAFNRGALLDSFDMERLEVLRGPQGLLFGRNTTGGTISVIRSRPDPDKEASGKIRATVGSFNRTDFEGVLTAPIIPGLLAAKAGIAVKKHDGEFKNVVFGGREGKRDMRDYLLALVATPSDETNFYLSFERMEDNSEIPPYVPIFTPDILALPGPKLLTPSGLGTLGFPTYVNGQSNVCRNPATAVVCVPLDKQRNGVETRQQPAFFNLTAVTFEASQQMGAIRLVGVTGYRRDTEKQVSDFDVTRFALQRNSKVESSKQFTQEVRAESSFEGPFNFVAGAFYTKYSFIAEQFLSIDRAALDITLNPGVLFNNSNNSFRVAQKTRSVAMFFQGDLDVTDELRITAGARQTWDRKSTNFRLFSPVIQPFRDQFLLGPQQGPVSNSVKFNKLTPKIGIQYKVTPDVMTYASWTRGYNSGGFNGRAGNLVNAVLIYRPEVVDAYEIGFKSEWFNRRLRFNVAAYHNTMKDKQEDVLTVATLPDGSQSNVTATINAAKARYKGVEVDVAVVPTPGWTITGSAGYLNAKYLNYIANLAGQGLADLRDLKLRRTPKWTAGLVSDYEFDVGSGQLGFNAALYYTSRYETNALNDPRGSIPPVTKIDASVRYNFPVHSGLDLEVATFVKNITDNTTYDGTTSANTLRSFVDFAIPSVGRTWGASLTARF